MISMPFVNKLAASTPSSDVPDIKPIAQIGLFCRMLFPYIKALTIH